MPNIQSAAVRRHLDAWCELFEGCGRIADLPSRERATTVGVIERLRLVPGESVEAVLTDGTGRLRATWTTRDAMPGLELGRGLRLEGTVCIDEGTAQMRNPSWCLVRDPYSCQEATRPAARSSR